MRIRRSFTSKSKKIEHLLVEYIRRSTFSTILYSCATVLILAVTTFTVCEQRKYNKKQLDLEELRAIPQVVAVLDSIRFPESSEDRNVVYTIENLSSAASIKLRQASTISRLKENPFLEAVTTTLLADIFPTQKKSVHKRHEFKLKGEVDTLYFHVRLDYEDLLHRSYCYRASYWIIAKVDSVKGEKVHINCRGGLEKSEFER